MAVDTHCHNFPPTTSVYTDDNLNKNFLEFIDP